MIKISKLYGMPIYTSEGKKVGVVNDVILNLETGEVIRLTTAPLKKVRKEEAEEVIRKNSVLYKHVLTAKDIVIISSGRTTEL